ncbi:hypothetical protein ACA910_002446 [Epithemia clementina (nom. ined.)]
MMKAGSLLRFLPLTLLVLLCLEISTTAGASSSLDSIVSRINRFGGVGGGRTSTAAFVSSLWNLEHQRGVGVVGCTGTVLSPATIIPIYTTFSSSHPTALHAEPEGSSTTTTTTFTHLPAPVHAVQIYANADEVGAAVRDIVEKAAQQALQERGHFALAIPGGSILKMLIGCGSKDESDWTAQTTLSYVNHKCVPMDDIATATHAKALNLFLKDWNENCHVILMDGTDNGPQEAASYQAKLQALSQDVLPRRGKDNGLPMFDLALIGVGDDGHVGSLYPNREEVLVGSHDHNNDDPNQQDIPWVLSVEMKNPPSITLSLPVMQAAKQVVVAACGVSDKYPQGKSAGMQRAIANPHETLTSFPAVGLRSQATWILDQAAASQLGPEYLSPSSSSSS